MNSQDGNFTSPLLGLDHYTDESNAWQLYGYTLTTHRLYTADDDSSIEFPYQAVAAAIAIVFFRTTVHTTAEPLAIRLTFAALLAALAYARKSYELILAVEVFSYSFVVLAALQPRKLLVTWLDRLLYGTVGLVAAAALSYGFAHCLVTGLVMETLQALTPNMVLQSIYYLIPIKEVTEAYDMIQSLALPYEILPAQVAHLFFVTFHIQTGMGFLGIHFLKQEQQRRNMLVRMDVAGVEDGDEPSDTDTDTINGKADKHVSAKLARSRRFQRTAIPFIFRTALPYMLQIIGYGNLNAFSFHCFCHDLHRTVRYRQTLSHDAHWMAMTQTPVSPERKLALEKRWVLQHLLVIHLMHFSLPPEYATSIDNIANTIYELFNRKLFSLPKILLLPTVMARQPWLVVQVFPFIMLTDWVKASAVTYLTTKIEHLQEELQHWRAIRTKVESFDLKNAELLHRSGSHSLPFTQRRWEALTNQVQNRMVVMELLQRSKGFFAFIHRNFVFSVLIDCALANLIAVGKIVSAEIFVFSRAMEDAVDLLLMRSRSEAELARMATDLERLAQVRSLWQNQESSTALLACTVSAPSCVKPGHAQHAPQIVLRNLHYSRGTAQVRADHVELAAGVYALTGTCCFPCYHLFKKTLLTVSICSLPYQDRMGLANLLFSAF